MDLETHDQAMQRSFDGIYRCLLSLEKIRPKAWNF